MNIFETHANIVDEYASYIRSFVNISDEEIKNKVDEELNKGKLWPKPLLQFNPAYETAGSIESITSDLSLHQDIPKIFSGYSLYRHQLEAIRLGQSSKDFIVTSGTGSGKSLTFIASIFNHLLKNPQPKGVSAVIVYPMNALINSQTNEFNMYKTNYEEATGNDFPIRYGQYTGQEKEDKRQEMRDNPPDILLTNYMMLELLLTRSGERSIRNGIYENLNFLVFDELHTYRGRQGADVAMLIRRIQSRCKQQVCCIGTSATMASGDDTSNAAIKVSKVAKDIFGRHFETSQIINETLARSLETPSQLPTKDIIAKAIRDGIDIHSLEEDLIKHPVAIWIENKIALEETDGQLQRRTPQDVHGVVEKLSDYSGMPISDCTTCLSDFLLWISTVNEKTQAAGSRYTILPYRLHQFFAQTGSVYTTLDQGKDRYITLEPGAYKRDEEDKQIFPNVFSRATGHPYICVTRVDDLLTPREFRSSNTDDEELGDGYLIIGDNIWNQEEDLDYLPESWVNTKRDGSKTPIKKYADSFPYKLYFDEHGNCSEDTPMKYWGWFMEAPLLFDPTGGVFYNHQTNEGTKLTMLGSEGRSTSTSITGCSILNQLHESGASLRDQKFLSFTDNRQDAALQAGHFNDFIKTIQFRSAVHKALLEKDEHELNFANIGEGVFNSLSLDFRDFARGQSSKPSLPQVVKQYEETFKGLLLYRSLEDLQRSWRNVLPNLEQCALLNIGYDDLEEIVKEDEFWSDIPLVGNQSPDERFKFISTILDYFRLEYAIHSQNFLSASNLKENEKKYREKLAPPWTLDRKENLQTPYVLRVEPLNRRARLKNKSLGVSSSVGKYIKQIGTRIAGLDPEGLKGDHYKTLIYQLMDKLKQADYLYEDIAKNNENEDIPVYQLRVEKILWKLGDKETVKADPVKQRSYKKISLKPNVFFQELYQQEFTNRKRLFASDHTGQISSAEERQNREEKFRADWKLENSNEYDDDKIRRESISAMFCSPTMELGVDIGGLTVVHMRNAPPNAANYAQRSGRAGRNGQGALVFTYCSSYSPHDRHYFQNQAEIVAGRVQAPRIDLCNQELLLTHLNALAISEIGLPGLGSQGEGRPSLTQLIDINQSEMPLLESVEAGLQIQTEAFEKLKSAFKRTVSDFDNELKEMANPWYTDDWISQNLNNISEHLNNSIDRWRELYVSSKKLLTKASQAIEGGRLTTNGEEYRRYERLQKQANRQLDLLRNDSGGFSNMSEFYPFRYLAAEGFLPGYNFTRLPVRIFVPSTETVGEYISRPRNLALREFGPLNIIYHNGKKFRVSQIVVQDAETALSDVKISTKAGYCLMDSQSDLEICPFSQADLSDNANKEHIHHLLDMKESRGEEIDRISCEEEERRSKGFDIKTYFSVDGERFDSIKKAFVRSDDTQLLNLRFIPAARLVHINNRWFASKAEGFPLGMTSGNWKASIPDPDEAQDEYKLVKLWTSSVSDALYIEPINALGLDADGVVTLQYALKQAIESVFQVESSEIGVQSMGDAETPNIMIYESAEGSLGILSQLVEDVTKFKSVIAKAEEICNFNDEGYLAKASYNDLLSYYNQRDHQRINRFLIQDALKKLQIADIELQTSDSFGSYEEQYQFILQHLDPTSSTELKFIKFLFRNKLRLPDSAQRRVPGIYCQPDFYYEPRIWVFCDGTPHDQPEVRARDNEQRQLIIDKGDEVWHWHYSEDLEAKVSQRPDIFRKVR